MPDEKLALLSLGKALYACNRIIMQLLKKSYYEAPRNACIFLFEYHEYLIKDDQHACFLFVL